MVGLEGLNRDLHTVCTSNSYLTIIFSNFKWILHTSGARGSVVVKALCCKPGGRGFKSR
jgi:hypothetical protein